MSANERPLSNVDGVQHVEVHYATGRVEIEYDDGVADSDAFAQTIENRGKRPSPPNTMNRQTVTQYYRKHRKAIVTATSGLLYGGGWSLGYLTGFDTASAAILVLATIVGGYDIAQTAYHEVANRTLGIKTLVMLAAIGAIVIGEYWEAAAVVFLFSLGSYLEGRTMRKTRTALQEPLEMTPKTATVRRDGEHQEVPARDVEEGEVVIVKPGEKIPVDSDVVDGESAVNQAPVTGERAPVHKADGDEVLSLAATAEKKANTTSRTPSSARPANARRLRRTVGRRSLRRTRRTPGASRFPTRTIST